MLGNHDVQDDQSGSPAGDQCGGDGVQLKKGPWTTAEDAVLTEYVRKHGEGNWNVVQRNTGLARCGKSCRLRWANHLRPNLKKGSFSPEEERLIVELHAQLGNKWARMAAQLPGRTDNEIKNYWNTRVKRRHRQGLSLYPQEIQAQPHGGGRRQLHHQHPYHHHQQQQQQQQQQTPQSSHSHHSHQTPASTPTTPTSSFTFHTTPTTAAHCHHLQYFSRSPTPNCLSPSPPPPLSPSSGLHSPHQHQSFPTLALFDSSSITTATNPTNLSTGYTETSSFSPFNVHRAPPILQTPLRFKRFQADTTTSSSATPITNYNTNYNHNHNHNNMYQSSSFPPPAFSTFLRSPPSFSTPPQPNCNTFSPFSSDPVPFVSNDSWSSISLRTQQLKEYSSANFPNSSVFALRPELPSSQLFSHLHHRGSSAELSFVDDHEDIDHDQKLSLSGGGSGLLDDLLDETNHHMNSMEDKRDFSGFNNHWSVSVPGSMKPKEETEADQMNNSTAMHEDLSKLFNAINPSMQIPAEWYMDMNDIGGEEASNGGRRYSSVISDHDDDNMNMEMQQIASMFRVVVDNTTTCQDSSLMLS